MNKTLLADVLAVLGMVLPAIVIPVVLRKARGHDLRLLRWSLLLGAGVFPLYLSFAWIILRLYPQGAMQVAAYAVAGIALVAYVVHLVLFLAFLMQRNRQKSTQA